MNVQDTVQEMLPWVSQYGLLALYGAILLRIPMVIFAAGVLSYFGVFSWWAALWVAVLGGISRDQCWFWIGRFYAKRFLPKFSRLAHKVERFKRSLQTKEPWVVVLGHFVYGGSIVSSLAMGMNHYPFRRFLAYSSVGVAIWASVGFTLGYFFGTGVDQAFQPGGWFEHLMILIAGAVVS